MIDLSDFVDQNGCWVYKGDFITGLNLLSQSSLSCPILDLREIPLSSIPKSIINISNLQELYLGHNSLSQLPDCIGAIDNLKILSLGCNHISTLPKSLENRWSTLQKIFLGQNQISEMTLDEEWMTAFKQGSIGRNPIAEPISPLWMMKQDAIEFPDRIRNLLPFNGGQRLQRELLPLTIQLIQECCEPMIYEKLFDGVWIEKHDDGFRIQWNDFFSNKLLQLIGWEILPFIPRGSIVHRSLDKWKITNYNFHQTEFTDLLWKPNWIQNSQPSLGEP